MFQNRAHRMSQILGFFLKIISRIIKYLFTMTYKMAVSGNSTASNTVDVT